MELRERSKADAVHAVRLSVPADVRELRPTRLSKKPSANNTPPITSAPVAIVAMAGSSRRVSGRLANSDRTTTTAPNERRIPPIPIKPAAAERIGAHHRGCAAQAEAARPVDAQC